MIPSPTVRPSVGRCLALTLTLVLSAATPVARPSDEAGRAQRPTTHVRYYSIKGQSDRAALARALESWRGVLLRGPSEAESKPGRFFVAIGVPVDTDRRKLERALRKLGKTEELAWTCFEGRDDGGTRLPELGPGFRQRDHILGMSGDLRWFDSNAGVTQFYHLPKKLDAADIRERYHKLFEPFGGGTLGTLIGEEIVVDLAHAPDERTTRKLEKALAKLPGVVTQRVEGATLHLQVALEDLLGSDPEQALPGEAGDEQVRTRGSWPTAALWALLDDLELAPPQSSDSR